MTLRRPITRPLALTLLTSGMLAARGLAQERPLPPVRHIDHIMIRADDPGELYAFFTETLKLPVAWPLAVRGGVASGGVGFGNVNVEAIRFPSQTDRPAGTRLVGFAFAPAPLRESLAELDRRGITYAAPRPFVSTGPGGVSMTFFTNVTLRQFSDSDRPADATIHIFLSEYNPAYVDAEQRRARLRTQLAAAGGGPLGVTGVQEVVVGTTDVGAADSLWGMLLRPTPAAAPGVWKVGDGPAIRLVAARENGLQGLVVRVASLRQARVFLQERGLLGSASEAALTIAPSKVHGLSIRLVETSGPG